MKTLITQTLYCIALVAALCWISGSNHMLKAQQSGNGDNLYPFFLVMSVAYTHWFLWRFFIPWDRMSQARKEEIQTNVHAFYRKGFFKGTIGTGYFLVGLYVINYFMPFEKRIVPQNVDLIFWALLALTLGILAKVHGVMIHLMNAKE